MNNKCTGCLRCDEEGSSACVRSPLETGRLHYIKILPDYYKAVISRTKTFEVRTDDRDYQVNDYVVLREWTPKGYTGSYEVVQITYILGREPEHKQYVAEGKVIFSFNHYYESVREGLWVFNKLREIDSGKDTAMP